MKKFIIAVSIMVIAFTARSQAVLEHVYLDEDLDGPIKLQNYGWVYYSIHPGLVKDLVKIYSTDHNLLKSIPLIYPNGFIFFDISNVSDVLFNSDTKIEVLYGFYTSYPKYAYGMYLINEDGSILQEFPNYYHGWIFNIDGNYKMRITSTSVDSNSYIYDLPGTISETQNQQPPDLFTIYPNPCKEYLNVAITNYPADLSIISTSGIVMGSYHISTPVESRINIKTLPQGNYIYTIKHRSGSVSTGKLAVIH